MDKTEYSKLTDEELLDAKKKLKKSKIIHAALIGFLGGIVLFGVGAWSLSPNRQLGFLIPMLIPIFIIYRLAKSSKNKTALEDVLKDRNLN